MKSNGSDGNFKLHFLKTKFIYLTFLFIGVVAVFLSIYYENGNAIELSFGLLSGALVALVTSFTVSQKRGENDSTDRVAELLDLISDVNADKNNLPHGIGIYPSAKGEGLDISKLICDAKERVWILSTDMSNFVIRHGDCVVKACQNNPSLNIRVLSCHPQNLFSATRYGEIGWDSEAAMADSISESNFSLRQIRDRILKNNPGADVKMRVYFSQPTVKMILVDDRLIISHFIIGSRSSDTVHICCNVKQCADIAKDFETLHFEALWNESVDLDAEFNIDAAPVYTLSSDCKLVRYSIDRAKSLSGGKPSAVKRFLKSVSHLFREHISNLITPIIFTFIAVVALFVLRTVDFFEQDKFQVLNNCLNNMLLGFISGSLLSSVEYLMQAGYDKISAEEQRAKRAADAEMLCRGFNRTLGENSHEFGVKYCANRNDVDLRRKILEAKERVWIYATNHKYVSSLNVTSHLAQSDMDVRFLMLSPKSMFVSTRFNDIPGKKCAEEFSTEISNNLQHLIREYKGSKTVKARLFYDQPTFMMYLVDNTLIVSHILKQGRAREQVHFVFDLRFPDINNDTKDYIEHFLAVWDRAVPCTEKAAAPCKNKTFYTVKGGELHRAVPSDVETIACGECRSAAAQTI